MSGKAGLESSFLLVKSKQMEDFNHFHLYYHYRIVTANEDWWERWEQIFISTNLHL